MGVDALLDVKRLGRGIKDRRLALDLSQEDLAKRAEVSSAYISRLERGLYEQPGAVILERIGRALGFRSWSELESAGTPDQPGTGSVFPDWTDALFPPIRKGHVSPDWRTSEAIARAGAPTYPIAIVIEAVANAGRGGGYVEEWAFVSFEEGHNRDLRAFRASGVCMEPHVNDGDTVIVDPHASPQDGHMVAALNLDTGDLLIKWYSGRNGSIELRPEQGEPIILPVDRVQIVGVVIQVNRKAPRRRR